MKRIVLILAMVFATTTYAQTQKGNFAIGSNFGLSFQSQSITGKYDGVKQGEISISKVAITPNILYFVADNFGVGLELGYTYTKQESEKQSEFAIAPSLAYFFPIQGNVKPFVGGRVGFGSMAGETDETKFNGLLLGAGAGVAYFVNENVAFTASAMYDYRNYTNTKDSKGKLDLGTFGLGLGISVFF